MLFLLESRYNVGSILDKIVDTRGFVNVCYWGTKVALEYCK